MNSVTILKAAVCNTDIRVTARSVYGTTKLYPANPAAEQLAKIAGTKTLTVYTLKCAKELGLKIMLDGEASLAELVKEIG